MTKEEVDAQARSITNPKPVEKFEICVSRRTVVLAELRDGRTILVKWPDSGLDQDNGRELRVFDLLGEMALPEQTRGAIPRVLALDAERKISVYDAVQPCSSMRELFDAGTLTTGNVVALAGVLAGLHATPVADIVDRHDDLLMTLPAPKDTLLSVTEYSHGLGMEFDAWIRVVQGLGGHLADLHRAWDPRALIHFDLRDDNILFTPSSGTGGVRVIDWEFACFGDPDYDVAYVVAQFLLHSMRGRPSDDRRSAVPADVVRQVHAFLSAYTAFSGPRGSDLSKTVGYAGLVLLQNASSRLEQFGSLGRIGHLSLLLAEGLIRNPETLVRHLAVPSAGAA